MTTSSEKLAKSIAAIEALDLEPIKFKAMRSDDGYGWSAQQADRAAAAYKRYLILIAKYPAITLAPDRDTDRFWHMHILDTRKYAADCDAVFGHFLHHFPYLGLRGADDARALDDAFATMQRLLVEEFGEQARAMGEGAVRVAAFCAVEPPPGQRAAFCAVEPPPGQQAAFCAVEPPPGQQAAFCAVEPPPGQQAAFCAVEPPPAARAERLAA